METDSRVDSSYSWVIAVACCWVTFVIQGLVRSAGVIYVALIDGFAVTRGQATWPFTLRMAIWNLSGPIAGALSYRWSIRVITITGVLIVTLGNVLCWFAADIYIVTIFFGVLQGIGVGMAVTLVPVIINQYFNKYKTSGAGIACAGATAGSFALPPLVEYTLEEYGLKGSFLMMGGITLHGVLGAALMRPATWLKPATERRKPSSYAKRTSKSVPRRTKRPVISTKLKETAWENNSKTHPGDSVQHQEDSCNEALVQKENIDRNLYDKKSSKTVRFSCEIVDEVSNDRQELSNGNVSKDTFNNGTSSLHQELPNGTIVNFKPASVPESAYKTRNIENGKLRFIDDESDDRQNIVSIDDLESGNRIEMHQLIEEVPEICLNKATNGRNGTSKDIPFSKQNSNRKNRTSVFAGFLEPAKLAWIILKNPMFLTIASNYSVFFLSYMTYLIVIVDYSLDLGVDKADSIFLVSTFSVADLAGRLGSGWITDSGFIKRKNLMMCNMITLGVLFIATSFAKTYFTLMGVSVTAGLVVGINLILFYALLDDYLEIRYMAMAVGLMNFSIGIISLVTPVLTGLFRDRLNSYDHLFHFLGILLIFCGFLWVLKPLQTSCKRTKSISLNNVTFHQEQQ